MNKSDIHERINELETQRNNELSINLKDVEINMIRSEIVVDYVFAYNVATNIMQDNEDREPQSVIECRQQNDWPK